MKSFVTTEVNLDQVRQNVRQIHQTTGVGVWAVVKADGYGLGAQRISEAVAPEVEGFCVFSLKEAADAQLWKRTGRESIALGPPMTLDADAWIAQHVRPAVTTVEQARALRAARPIVSVDVGMQRFTCPPERLEAVIEAGGCTEAFAHATRLEHVQRLLQLLGGRGMKLHAAASALLGEKEAWLDAVRPGLAMYREAVRVSGPLVEVHRTKGPVGYTGFKAERVGVILMGYSGGLRPGPCLINGQRQRVMEVGMQSAYVSVDPAARVGDEVILLGEDLPPHAVAGEWGTTSQEALFRLGMGGRAGERANAQAER